MKKVLLTIIIFFFLVAPSQAQNQDIYLPVIIKMPTLPDPILRLRSSNGIIIDILGPDSGWKLADPYWNPQIARIKGGGAKVNSALSPGQRLTNHEYDNVIETIPLSLRGIDQDKAMQTAHEMLQLLDQASNYWDRSYEYDPVWLEAKLPCNDCFTAYSRIIIGNIPELTNPFGQPFFSDINPEPVMEDITLIIEREPFWRPTEPGTIIGPLYNLIKNPDFELWNFGVADSQPDSWENLESLWITGSNNRQDTGIKWGTFALKVNVSGSTLTGASKGVTQVLLNTDDFTEYTIIAWVRSDGVSNGVGRILITYTDQLELYRESDGHGWTLYTGKITTGFADVVGISVEILTTAANTDGTFYIDGLMFVEGDWEQEAIDGILPYMSSSHIVNHWDNQAGDINWVDVWNIPGNISALTRLEFINNMSTLSVNLDDIRIGLRRANDIFQFEPYQDIPGINDTASSNDDSADFISISNQFSHMITRTISGKNEVLQNAGRFRAYVRIKEKKTSGTNTLKLKMTYGNGTLINKSLEEELVEIFDDWTSIDLTESGAIIFETKPNNNLGQIGYKVEAKRDSGSEGAALDYIMLMPTDGGFVKVGSAALPKGHALIIGSDESNYVRKGWAGSGWNLLYSDAQDNNEEEGRITSYSGQIYFDLSTKMFRIENGIATDITPSFVSDVSPNHMSGYGEYEGSLYIKNMVGDVMTLYRSSNGTTWEEVGSETFVGSLAFTTSSFGTFDNKLFFAVNVLNIGQTFIYTWDGTTLARTENLGGVQVINSEFVIFGGEFYWADQNKLFRYSTDSGAWSAVASSPSGGAVRYRTMEVFDNKIFLFDTFRIQTYDGGDTITQVFTKGTGGSGFISSALFENRIYGGLIAGTTGGSTGVKSVDGIDFILFGMPFGTRTAYMYTFNGVLYVLARDTSVSPAPFWLFTLNNQTVLDNVPDWNGRTFLSPPRTRNNEKRHRFFFNYNRTSRVNNIDDEALVGVGWIPQYLTIRGKN